MELIIILSLLLIIYVGYILYTRESFVSSSEQKINQETYKYYTRNVGGGLTWDGYSGAEKSFKKFRKGRRDPN